MSDRQAVSGPTARTGPMSAGGRPASDDDPARSLAETVNHHLRTPLTAMLGHAELLGEGHLDLPDEARQSLECLHRAGGRLQDVVLGICELIDIACADRTARRELDISQLVSGVVADYRPSADQRGIRLKVETDEVHVCPIDRQHVRRAVGELLANALAHSPDGSTVDVAVTGGDGAVTVCIRDRGRGINAADRERLTRPFEREDGCGRPVDGGQGLGLAVAATVAGSHGGRLTLADRRRGGLVACLELSGQPTPGSAPWQSVAAAWSAGLSDAGAHNGERPGT
jgi:signal transduction histidine kinase